MSCQIRLYVGGQMARSEFAAASTLYLKQIRRWHMTVVEVPGPKWDRLVPSPGEHWVGLTEGGRGMDSPGFSHALDLWTRDRQILCFLIGGFDGLPGPVLAACQERLSLGAMTWPHLMARTLLLEQIYRAQQRSQGHPYSFV
jgi:hypothetical protein